MKTGMLTDMKPETGELSISETGAENLFDENVMKLLLYFHNKYNPRRKELLEQRQQRQARYDAGELPDYEDRQSEAATGSWKVKPLPSDLTKRRVEITGPVNSAKMVINMLSRNSEGHRADMAMLDFEDSMKPSWNNVTDGLRNLIGAVEGTLSHIKPAAGGNPEKVYKLNPDDMAGIMVRVRGLHLDEANVRVDDTPVSAGMFDLVMSAYHTAEELISQGKTPKFYVPKCEHYLEARWWNEVFGDLERALHIPHGTLKATFLIETLPAAFQIEEILYEIRDHAAGLNVGRWDKIFSDIKVLKMHKDRIMADRVYISMDRYWMENYAKRLIKICHSRGAFAIGGMAAFTPGSTPEIRDEQLARVKADKEKEARLGHDGCWVSHPYFIGPAMQEFKRDNQLDVLLSDFDKYPDLLPSSEGPKTMKGLRTNIRVGIGYMHGWNRDIGCVAWDNLMEDLATLEISRAQTWQWLHHQIKLDDGETVTRELVEKVFDEELEKIISEVEATMANKPSEIKDAVAEKFKQAAAEAKSIYTKEDLTDFLTLTSKVSGSRKTVQLS